MVPVIYSIFQVQTLSSLWCCKKQKRFSELVVVRNVYNKEKTYNGREMALEEEAASSSNELFHQPKAVGSVSAGLPMNDFMWINF